MHDDVFLQRFEDASMPMAEWHHRQHVKVAYLYLLRHPFAEALVKMRTGVKAFNAAHNFPDGPTRGYHETLTQVWLRLVYYTICEFGPEENADGFYDKNSLLHDRRVLTHFYSIGALSLPQAKEEFIQPDLLPFPESANVYQPSAEIIPAPTGPLLESRPEGGVPSRVADSLIV